MRDREQGPAGIGNRMRMVISVPRRREQRTIPWRTGGDRRILAWTRVFAMRPKVAQFRCRPAPEKSNVIFGPKPFVTTMNKTRYSHYLAVLLLVLAFQGCGARDTEVDGIPGPGARTTTPITVPPSEQRLQNDSAAAGINSVGRPSGSAGGNPGPSTVGESQTPSAEKTMTPSDAPTKQP